MFGQVGKALSFWEGIQKLFSIGAITLFCIFILLSALIDSMNANDPSVFISSIGKKLIFWMDELQSTSQNIIDSEGVFDASQGKLKAIWEVILVYGTLFSSLFVVWIWVHIFAVVYGWISQSDHLSTFKNHLFGLLIFLTIQSIYLLVFVDNPDKIALLLSPYRALWVFMKSIPYLLSPISTSINRIGDLISK